MAKGWHSPTGSRTQQARSLLDVLVHRHGQPEFTVYNTAPPGGMSDVHHNVRVDSCCFPRISISGGAAFLCLLGEVLPFSSHVGSSHFQFEKVNKGNYDLHPDSVCPATSSISTLKVSLTGVEEGEGRGEGKGRGVLT